jgi:hypothetical protein
VSNKSEFQTTTNRHSGKHAYILTACPSTFFLSHFLCFVSVLFSGSNVLGIATGKAAAIPTGGKAKSKKAKA